jgi:hypothetical protein
MLHVMYVIETEVLCVPKNRFLRLLSPFCGQVYGMRTNNLIHLKAEEVDEFIDEKMEELLKEKSDRND